MTPHKYIAHSENGHSEEQYIKQHHVADGITKLYS